MTQVVRIASIFPRHLFWDVKMEQLDVQRDKVLVIPRALFATTPVTFEHDIEKLENIYSQNEIASILKSTKEHISNRVCELVTHRYHLPVFHRFSHANRQ